MGKCMTVVVLLVAIVIGLFLANQWFGEEAVAPKPPKTGWWGWGKRKSDSDKTIRPFEVQVPSTVLRDLIRRLEKARLGEDLENNNFRYGFQVNYMKEVIDHWINKFDWNKQEKLLNQYEQYKTTIEGIQVHFVHVKPAKRKGKPLLLIHGWPGSIWEFHKAIPMLVDPEEYEGTPEDTFEVICPSIPGYGFSEAPHQKEFNLLAAARVFAKLMDRLGFKRFYVQGGDWGGMIGTTLGQAYPERIIGAHLNMFSPPARSVGYNLRLVMGSYFPGLIGLSDYSVQKVYPLSDFFLNLLDSMGYAHLQATRPDTVAFALNDSPVGLAAYILEKFPAWTNPAYIDLPDGGVTQKFDLDELLTNVMIYWVTGSIGPSMRFYKEIIGNAETWEWDNFPVTVPVGLASYPHELTHVPEAFAKLKYLDIVQFTDMPSGGHFAAFEGPEMLVNDLRSFVRKLRERKKKKLNEG